MPACAGSGHGASMIARASVSTSASASLLKRSRSPGFRTALGGELRRIQRDRIARRPVLVELAVGVAPVGERRDVPRRLRIPAQVQHVVVVRVAAQAHRDRLDQRRAEAGARALGRPPEGAGNRLGIGAVDRDPRHAVARGLVRERPHRRLIRHRRRQRGLVVLDAEDRRQPARGAQVDRLVPLAERRSAFADERDGDALRAFARERHRHAGQRQRGDRQRRRGQQDAPVEIAVAEVLAVGRRPGLPHLRVQHHAHGRRLGTHRQRGAEVANHRADDVAGPGSTVGSRYFAPRRRRIAAP